MMDRLQAITKCGIGSQHAVDVGKTHSIGQIFADNHTFLTSKSVVKTDSALDEGSGRRIAYTATEKNIDMMPVHIQSICHKSFHLRYKFC